MARNVLLVLSAHESADKLIQHASHDMYKPGDRFQLLWVTKHADLLKEAAANGEVEPTFRGQDADKSRAVQEEEGARDLQKEIAAKYGPTFDSLKIPYQIHVVPTTVFSLGAHIVESAAVESAALVVLPKVAGTLLAAYVNEHFAGPVVLA